MNWLEQCAFAVAIIAVLAAIFLFYARIDPLIAPR